MGEQTAGVALPRWKSHKEVWAAKITGVSSEPGVPARVPDDSGMTWHLANHGRQSVSNALLSRVPEGVFPVGGYYVRYLDGFESWSPAKAFEEGYTRID